MPLSELVPTKTMPRTRTHRSAPDWGMLTKNRLEAFSDGVFAIAITLLVIEIHPPTLAEGESLAHGLWEQWPNYLGYILSFLVLGVMWLNHHRIFEPAKR